MRFTVNQAQLEAMTKAQLMSFVESKLVPCYQHCKFNHGLQQVQFVAIKKSWKKAEIVSMILMHISTIERHYPVQPKKVINLVKRDSQVNTAPVKPVTKAAAKSVRLAENENDNAWHRIPKSKKQGSNLRPARPVKNVSLASYGRGEDCFYGERIQSRREQMLAAYRAGK